MFKKGTPKIILDKWRVNGSFAIGNAAKHSREIGMVIPQALHISFR